MREFRADIVLCHRANDYHPDHRAVGLLVQDAAYVVTVPNVAPLTPPLARSPVVGHLYDAFTLPNPFVPSIAIDTDSVFERKIDMVHCHTSQVYEWLPFNNGILDEVPEDDAGRRAWLAERLYGRFGALADSVRDKLVELYGQERGSAIRTAESVAISEYGRGVPEDEMPRLFPFLPRRGA
jgi:LmbE family N-acetylglucosaminyl deacetylase